MLFNSYPFIFIFLPLTFIGSFLLGAYSRKLAILWLGAASMVFYGFWDTKFVSLLLGSIVANYYFGRWLDQARIGNKAYLGRLLFVAILANLLVLGYFKYCNFFIGTFVEVFGGKFVPFDIILPLGISFFTFTQIGFLVDVSRGLTSEASLGRYLLFVTYFPHLIAGPLLHHKQVMPQFLDKTAFRLNAENITVGLTIFVLALAKKIFLADSFGEIVDPIFQSVDSGHQPKLFEAWSVALAYAMQMYFDFSAYSEMAIGLSLMFNIRLPLNFNSPFKANSVIDYWQRWHISLTKYIYEYLYTPITLKFMRLGLGKSPVTEYIYTVLLPTIITFLIIGLWHGANWTFIVFGALHASYMVINYLWISLKKRNKWKPSSLSYLLICRILTYMSVVIALVFFRAETVSTGLRVVEGMFGGNGISLPSSITNILPSELISLARPYVYFEGLLPNTATQLNPLWVICLLGVGHVIVWSLPNIHQIMNKYKISVEDLNNKSQKIRSTVQKFGWLQSIAWRPTTAGALSLGVLFFCLIVAMASNKPSTFLYYQF